MGSCLCDQCAALCCRYFVLEIDKPETRRQFDDVRWYLVHEQTFVFIEKKKWYLGVYARCKHLQADNRCGIYENRPRICREYSTDNCDYHGGEYDWEVLFTSAEQLERYAEDWLKRKRSGARVVRGGKREAGRDKGGRAGPRKPPRLHVTLLAGGLDRGPRNGDVAGSGHAKGNGHSNGVSLPILRGV